MAAITPPPIPARTSSVRHSGPSAVHTTPSSLHTLSPPRMRQPYTPPPKKDDSTGEEEEEEKDEEDHEEVMPALQLPHSNHSQGVDSMDDLAICASPGEYARPKRRRKTSSSQPVSDTQSIAYMLRKGIVDHQLGLSLNLLLLLAMSCALFPDLRNKLDAFFLLSYPSSHAEHDTLYGTGPRDLYFVAALVVLFTGVRAFMLDYVLTPLGGIWGIQSKRVRLRFAEQSYLLLYYIVYWNWGLYLFIRDTPPLTTSTSSPFTALLISLWHNFPTLLLDSSMKFYYLSQLAFWVQQIAVVHLEEKRKDHYQMLTHHVFTVALMSTSYGYRQWRVGNAVLVCMDIVEIIFPIAKNLKYLGFRFACDVAFGLFVLFWLFARHGCYLSICWSIYAHVSDVVMPYGVYSLKQTTPIDISSPRTVTGLRLSSDGGDTALRHIYQPFVDPNADTVAFNARIRWSFLALLGGLQCITLMWFFMIMRVVVKVLRGEGADDTRSDDEGEDEDEGLEEMDDEDGESAMEKARFIEVEADSTEYVVRRAPSPGSAAGPGMYKRSAQGRKGNASFASGLNLGERKEILNRIGCLSDEQLARERERKIQGER